MGSETSVSNPDVAADLFAIVYEELRRIARSQRRGAGGTATLETTALVHEVYLKLSASDAARGMDRVHFLSLAARAMRQILVDHARSRSRLKRGGDCIITGLNDEIGGADEIVDLVALDAALSDLAEFDPRAGRIVEWRIFSGLEIAEIVGVSSASRADRSCDLDGRRLSLDLHEGWECW